MQVQKIQNNNTNFGAIKANAAAKQYIKENFSDRAMQKLNKLIEQQKDNPYDIYLYRQQYMPTLVDIALGYPCRTTDFLVIKAGDRTFQDAHLLATPINKINKAVKYLSKYLSKYKIAQEGEIK